MKWLKSSKNAKVYLFLGICLILIGLILFSYKTPQIVKAPTLSLSPVSITTSVITFAKVTRVYDGDTIQISGGEKIRYIGVDSTEVYPKEQCYSQEARRENSNLVMGKEVRLVKDISNTDKYGRLLRYVYIDNIFINDELVKNGFAKVETVPPDVKFANLFLESQKYARDNKLGLWSACPR